MAAVAAQMRTEFPSPTLTADSTDGYLPDIATILTVTTDARATSP
jgi:hypothetical protein